MRKFFLLLILTIFSINIYPQNKKIEKIISAYDKGDYEKCLTLSEKYRKKDQKNPVPYYYTAFSYFSIAKQNTGKPYNRNLRKAVQYVYRAKRKDKDSTFFVQYIKELTEIKDSMFNQGEYLYRQKRLDEAKFYFEYLVKIFSHYTSYYQELFGKNEGEVAASMLEIPEDQLNQTDVLGRKQGIWIAKYDNGNLKYKINFKDGHPAGEYIRYYPNGKIRTKMWFDSTGIRSAAIHYDKYGDKIAMGYYYNKQKDSLWQYFESDSILILEENYNKGVKNGEEIKYFPYGIPAEERYWKNGKPDSVWRRYYPSGQIMFETYFKNGQLNGKYTKYFENGNVEISGQYKDDLHEGKWVMIDGVTGEKTVLNYINGRPENEDELLEKEQDWFKKLEENRQKLIDPEKYQNNPDEYIRKSGIR